MQDMIKKIVDMDEKAQEITEEAKRSKALSAQEIAETKERIRENYLARARKRIELNRIQEKNQARQILADAEKKYEVQLIKMQELYRQQGGNWVDAIVGREKKRSLRDAPGTPDGSFFIDTHDHISHNIDDHQIQDHHSNYSLCSYHRHLIILILSYQVSSRSPVTSWHEPSETDRTD